ncbi:MAG: tRNA (adenine-N1)-methyltransferase [Thermoplasmata archaeon]
MPDGAPVLHEGETILLWRPGERGRLLKLIAHPQTLDREGVVDLAPLVGRPPGTTVTWAGATYVALRPSLSDLVAQVERKAQIVTPKDAMQMLYLAGVAPGGRVLEAGAGSGALTIVLAHFVGPSGRVVTFDRRDDFLEIARRNVARAGLVDRVEFRVRDVAADGFDATGAGSVLLDLPEPWAVLEAARTALVPGGGLATYTPTYNQLERTVRELRRREFEDVRSVEILERSLHVGDGGTRPEFEMLGHTGFLTGARRGV